jgi:hypothetical protein
MIGDYRSPSDTDLPLCSQVLHAPCRNRYGFAAGLVVTHYEATFGGFFPHW